MPFASFNPINPRTYPWNFHKKILRLDNFEKWHFFESAILSFFYQKKIASSLWKLATNYVLEWMGLKFYDYDSLHFTAKNQSPQTFQAAVYWNKWFHLAYTMWKSLKLLFAMTGFILCMGVPTGISMGVKGFWCSMW